MNAIQLNKEQIDIFTEISILKSSADDTLDFALKFHQKEINKIRKIEREEWEKLAAIHNIDIRNSKWVIEEFEGELKLLKIDNDE